MNMAVKYSNQKSPGHSSVFTNTSRSLFGNTFFNCSGLPATRNTFCQQQPAGYKKYTS
jgi:hypothetical protein